MHEYDVVLFDGICHFCDASVQFIIKRDPRRRFKFASLQSETGQHLLETHGVSKNVETLVLIHQGRAYAESTAVLKICRGLKMPWKLLYPLMIVPSPIRNFFYNVVADNRHRWFGKKEACTLPSARDRERFL